MAMLNLKEKAATGKMPRVLLFGLILALRVTGCGNLSDVTADSQNGDKTKAAAEDTPSYQGVPLYNGDGGRGIVIAVPAPDIRGGSVQDAWMPQFFQDLITGDLARFSAMTVVDRSNEALVRAEQQLSLSGDFSEDDYVRIGNMTNAKYIVAGSILKVSNVYTVSFRINNVETNEVQATFGKQYSYQDIENGLAACEAARELLAGMGVELTRAGETALLTVPEVQVRSTAQLARGMMAEKNGGIVEALAFLSEAVDAGTTRTEANQHIQNIFADIPVGSIQERINYAVAQEAKWRKIFADLRVYIRENLPVFIYDFSSIEDTIDTRSEKVTLRVSPGVKVIPNRTVLFVSKTELDNWFHISGMEENKDWVKNVRFREGPLSSNSLGDSETYNLRFLYSIDIGLYDDYGDRVEDSWQFAGTPLPLRINISYLMRNSTSSPDPDFRITTQRKYYDNAMFYPFQFTVPFDNITDTLSPKIEQRSYVHLRSSKELLNVPVMTTAEWEQWLHLQEAER
jgi:TolB-like protein